MKKIFIIGGTGFIGKRLVKKLIEMNKYDLTLLVRNNEESRDFNVKTKIGDMFDKESVEKAMEKYDVVMHLASSHLKGKEFENYNGAENIIEACKKTKIGRIIFISSMAAKRNFLDDYGQTKLKIEDLIKKSGINYTIFRPSMVYSEDYLSQIGRSLNSIPLIIPMIGYGNYKMSPLFIEDLVNIIAESIENKKTINKIYDVTPEEKIRFNEIIDLCKTRFKNNKIKIHVPIFICSAVFKIIPFMSAEALKGINEDTNPDLNELKKDFKIIPRNFSEGIKNVNI